MAKPIFRILMSQVGGFIIFLILLALANLLIPFFHSTIYSDIVYFFNGNILLFFIMMIIGLVNEIFWNFFFPFNILAPMTSAVLSIFIVFFIFRVWKFINAEAHVSMMLPGSTSIYMPVALIVLLVGYIIILARHGRPREDYHEARKARRMEQWEQGKGRLQRKIEEAKKAPGEKIEWEDVGSEIKLAFYNLAKGFNGLFETKKGKEKKAAKERKEEEGKKRQAKGKKKK